METSSDPPHFSASLPLGKQQRPISCWEKNIYLEKHASVRTRKQEHFIPPSPSVCGFKVIQPQSEGNEVVTLKPWLLTPTDVIVDTHIFPILVFFRSGELCEALLASPISYDTGVWTHENCGILRVTDRGLTLLDHQFFPFSIFQKKPINF